MDFQLAQLAQMFPRLTHFTLVKRGGWDGYQTIDAVVAFAPHCPRLQALLLPNVHCHHPAALQPPFPVQYALRTLCLLGIDDVEIPVHHVPWLGPVLATMFRALDVRACAEPPLTRLHLTIISYGTQATQ